MFKHSSNMDKDDEFHCRWLFSDDDEAEPGLSDYDEEQEFESSGFFHKWLNRVEKRNTPSKKGNCDVSAKCQVKRKRKMLKTYREEMTLEDYRWAAEDCDEVDCDEVDCEDPTADQPIKMGSFCYYSGWLYHRNSEQLKWSIDDEEQFVYGWLYTGTNEKSDDLSKNDDQLEVLELYLEEDASDDLPSTAMSNGSKVTFLRELWECLADVKKDASLMHGAAVEGTVAWKDEEKQLIAIQTVSAVPIHGIV